jgi:hypothetical protein
LQKTLEDITVVTVLAHPDDEIIFGWPIMQEPAIKKKLIICSSDLHNPLRKSVSHRKHSLEEVCKRLQITDLTCLDYPSEFYHLESRRGSLSRFIEHVRDIIRDKMVNETKFVLYTHNILGEYGHMDHKLIHSIVLNLSTRMLYTDILLQSNWLPDKTSFSSLVTQLYFGKENLLKEVSLNLEWYTEFKTIYQLNGCWTWDKPPVTNCGVYLI